MTYAHAHLIFSIHSNIALRQKPTYVQSEGAYKLSMRITSFFPKEMKEQRILNAGNSYMIMTVSVIIACPMAVFLQEGFLLNPTYEMIEL
jgi:hypothetical protein